MAARSIWNGNLVLGAASVPVKMYSAIEDRKVRFHLLHDTNRERVQQRYVESGTDEAVETPKLRKAYEVEPEVYVVVNEDELASIEPPPSRDIEVVAFAEPGEIGPEWYERPYYLGPNGNEDAYFALGEALDRKQWQGIARWTMRKREYVGSLRAQDGYLMLVTLRFAGEVIDVKALPAPKGDPLSKKELLMAEQLVAMLEEDEVDPESFADEYRKRVLALVESKLHGNVFKFERPKTEKRPVELEAALAASLVRARKEKRSA